MDLQFPFDSWDQMVNTEIRLKKKESSAIWDSNSGSCSEAPCGAAEQNPDEQRADETPLIGEEHRSIIGSQLVMASTIFLFRLNCNTASLLLEFLLEQRALKELMWH